jgi:hypothetical protein
MCYKCAGSFPWRVYRLDVEICLWCKFLPRADATLPPIRELPSLTVSANESACVDGVFRNIESVARTGTPFYIHSVMTLLYTCPRKICWVTYEVFLPQLPAILGLFNYCSMAIKSLPIGVNLFDVWPCWAPIIKVIAGHTGPVQFIPQLPAILGLFNYCSIAIEGVAHHCSIFDVWPCWTRPIFKVIAGHTGPIQLLLSGHRRCCSSL